MGPCSVRDAVRPVPGVPSELLPVPRDLDDQALELLQIRQTIDSDWWIRYLAHAQEHLAVGQLHRLYTPAARAGVPRPAGLVTQSSVRGSPRRPTRCT